MGDDGAKASTRAVEEMETGSSRRSSTSEAGPGIGHSAPASPCLPRAPGPSTDSKIPRPTSLTSPVPLRRSGSLRLRGERNARVTPGGGFTPSSSPCTSILESAEAWKKSLRTKGTVNVAVGGDAFSMPCLRSQRHHRSLQSLTSTPIRPSSVDSYPHTPTPSPEEFDHSRSHNLNRFLLDHSKEFSGDRDREDLDSVRSYGSNCSTQSACDHAHFGRNGTTFSGRRMKYIVHCSSHPEPDEYRTPTQRANQQIRRLKALLEQSKKDLESKDENIFKLTKEVVELRLLRDEADGSVARESTSNVEVSPKLVVNGEVSRTEKTLNPSENDFGTPASLSDSGHFDDLLSTTQYSPSPRKVAALGEPEKLAEAYQRRIEDIVKRQNEKSLEDRKSLVDMYEKKMEEMSRRFHEKEKNEKKLLIEMYDKKIENILTEQSEKCHAEQGESFEESEKKMTIMTKNLERERQTLIAKYEKTIDGLQKLHQESLQRLKDMHASEVESLKELLLDANNRNSDLQQELFQGRERIVELEEEVEILQTTIKQQKVAQDDFEQEVLSKYLKEQKNTDLQNEQFLQERSILESEIEKLKDSIKILDNKMDDIDHWKQVAQDRSSALQALEENMKMVNHQLDVVTSSESNCKEEIEALTSKLQELKQSHKEIISQLESEHQSTLASIQKNLHDSIQKEAELEIRYQELQLHMESSSALHQEIASYKALMLKGKEELEKSHAEVASLQVKIDALLHNLTEKDKELSMKSERLIELEAEIMLLKKTVSDCQQSNIESVESANSELESLRGILFQKEKQLMEAFEKSATLTNREEELNSLILRSGQLQEEVHKLQNELSEHQRMLNQLETSNSSLNQKLESLEKLQPEIQTLRLTVKEGEAKNKEMKMKLDEGNAKFSSLENECILLIESISKKDQVATLNSQKSCPLEEKVRSLQKIGSDFEESQNELILTKMKLEEEQGLLTQLKSEIGGVRQLLAEGEEQLQESNKNIGSLKGEIKSLRQQLDHKDQELFAAVEKLHQLQEQSDSLQKKMVDLEKENSEFLVTKNKLEVELTAVKNQTRNLHPNSHSSSEHAQFSRNSMDNLQQVYQDLLLEKHKTESLKNEIESLKLSVSTTHNNAQPCKSSDRNLIPEKEAFNKEVNQSDEVAWLQAEIESLKKALADQEERHNEINLKMYLKGQEAAKFERKDEVLEMAAHAPEKVSIPELLSQLTETEKELEKVKAMYRRLADSGSNPEATLLFLKSAFYYFLTDEANCQGHLHAIQSILGFTESEKQAVDTMTYFRR